MLTNSDITELTTFRRTLHQFPEVSGAEAETARTIAEQIRQTLNVKSADVVKLRPETA